MIVLECEQGSLEWQRARLGIPTASQFHRIMTPAKRKPSSAAPGYRNELLAEYFLRQPASVPPTGYMERGRVMEDEAVQTYAFEHNVEVQSVGFCLRDDRLVGASPDALIGDDGGLEIKVFSAKEHVAALLGDKDGDHVAQIQGNLWITGRRWWDRVYYHPDLPSVTVRLERDEGFIADLAALVDAFVANLVAARSRLEALGCRIAVATGGERDPEAVAAGTPF